MQQILNNPTFPQTSGAQFWNIPRFEQIEPKLKAYQDYLVLCFSSVFPISPSRQFIDYLTPLQHKTLRQIYYFFFTPTVLDRAVESELEEFSN